jgi:hypothetical protein
MGAFTTDDGFSGLIGDAGLFKFVGFDKLFTQVVDVVTQAPLHTWLPYGFGQEDV